MTETSSHRARASRRESSAAEKTDSPPGGRRPSRVRGGTAYSPNVPPAGPRHQAEEADVRQVSVKVRWHREFPSRPHPQGVSIHSSGVDDDLPSTVRRVVSGTAGPYSRHRTFPVCGEGRRTAGLAAPETRPEIRGISHSPGPFGTGPGGGPRPTRHGRGGSARCGDRATDRRHGDREPAGTRRIRGDLTGGDDPVRARGRPALRPVPADGAGHPADHPRPRPGHPAPPPAARPARHRGRVGRRLPQGPGRTRLHRDPHPEGRGVRHRVRSRRLRDRLVRRRGVPGPVPAVLQAGHGRGVRAGLRDRAGVPRRAARHRTAPRAVHLARRGTGVRRRPPRRHGGAARGPGRHDRGGGGGGLRRLCAAGGGPAAGTRTHPGDPLHRRAGADRTGHRRGPAGRAGPVARARTLPVALGAARVRQRVPLRDRVPHGEAAVLHPPGARPGGVLQQLRPALPRTRTRHRRATAAPLRRLPRRPRPARRGAGAVRGLPGRVPPRHAPARRLRARTGTLDRAADRRRQHPPYHPLPPRPAPSDAVTGAGRPAG
ncbi:Aspartyl-tRNA synthetase @ Aspartyl-tRNA(Asn) synthetase [Streptomyces misionensis JCM 4497]